MSEINKNQIGYKPHLEYIDNYESNLTYNNYDISTLPNNNEDESIKDLIDNSNKIESIIDLLPNDISDKLEDIYDQVQDFIKNELENETLERVPTENDWNYRDEDTNEEWETIPDEDITMDEFNPDDEWDDDDDFFPLDKEEHTEEEIIEKEYVKNLVDLFEDYNVNLSKIVSNFWANFLTASINKSTDEIKMILDNILLSSSDVLDNVKHLLDTAVREGIIKNMKLEYFATLFNAEETIKHLKQLKAVKELRLRYAKIDSVVGNSKTNQMNNNILIANKLLYDKKYDIAYENLYRYLTTSNRVLNDTLQTYIQEMKSKQILIERKGIR